MAEIPGPAPAERVIEVFPCASIPYRCDGFDPADWPGEVPDFAAFAFLSRANTSPGPGREDREG